MTQNLRVQELDFDTIKDNLKEFLRSKPEFSDYDFEGSGISALLNVLAYNTHYLGVMANMQMNELFLDTASKRTTAALHASRLGYIPGSVKSPVATVNLEIFPNDTPEILTIGNGAIFTSSLNGTSFQFITTSAKTIARSNSGRYLFNDLEIREGTLRTFRYPVSNSNPVKYVIQAKNVDISTLKVKVQTSGSNTATTTFSLNKSIADIQRDSQVYYLRLNQAGLYEVFFGDSVISKAVVDGNIVILEYVETNGALANGASQFTFADTVQGYGSNLVTTVMPAFGGDDAQTADEIKISAQSALSTQNRAVTESDYKVAIQEIFPAESIAVWGGEKSDPPIYGRVFISIKPTGGGTLTESTKQYIEKELIRKKNVLTVTPIFTDPQYTYISVDSTVYYNNETSEYTGSTLSTLVTGAIKLYAEKNLGKFDNNLRFTKLCNDIDSVSPAIYSNITNLHLSKYIVTEFIRDQPQALNFGNPIVSGSLTSNSFNITNTTFPVRFDDVNGVIRVYYIDQTAKKVVVENAGTIDYRTGKILVDKLFVTSNPDIRVFVTPQSNDIFSLRENILMIEDSDITVKAIQDTNDSTQHIFTASR